MADAIEMQNRLSKIQNSEEIADLFGKLVSGKSGYKATIEKNKPISKCEKCSLILSGDEKFCPECGQQISRDKK